MKITYSCEWCEYTTDNPDEFISMDGFHKCPNCDDRTSNEPIKNKG